MVQLLIDHIVSDPDHRQGKPRIKNTGITVQNIVEDSAAGLSPEYLVEQFDLTLGQVYAALSYYYDHRDEIDTAIEADRKAAHELTESAPYKTSQQRTQQIRKKMETQRKKPE